MTYYSEYFRKRYEERMPKAKEMLGGKCILCGTIENLAFHHPPHVEKKFNISEGVSYSEKVFYKEVMKCQLLCSSCHSQYSGSTRKQNIVHGTLTAYTYYQCRCDLCRENMNVYKRNKRKKVI